LFWADASGVMLAVLIGYKEWGASVNT